MKTPRSRGVTARRGARGTSEPGWNPDSGERAGWEGTWDAVRLTACSKHRSKKKKKKCIFWSKNVSFNICHLSGRNTSLSLIQRAPKSIYKGGEECRLCECSWRKLLTAELLHFHPCTEIPPNGIPREEQEPVAPSFPVQIQTRGSCSCQLLEHSAVHGEDLK